MIEKPSWKRYPLSLPIVSVCLSAFWLTTLHCSLGQMLQSLWWKGQEGDWDHAYETQLLVSKFQILLLPQVTEQPWTSYLNRWSLISTFIQWKYEYLLFFSRSDMSNSLRPHGLQHARLPCPSLSPGACWNLCPLSQWCQPTISSSVLLFSSCPQSFPTSGSFLVKI